MKRLLPSLLALICAGLAQAQTQDSQPAPASPFVWIEAEKPDSVPDQLTAGGWAKPELLSGEVLQAQFDNKNIDSMPETIAISYTFQAPEAGAYDFWGRFVFTIRSDFQWRVNGGEWQTNSEDKQPLTNTQELNFWNPIGWSPMSESVQLKAGENKLEIQLRKEDRDDKDNFRFIADAFAFQKGGFQPNFKYAPGDTSWRDESASAAAGQVFVLPAEQAEEPRVEMALDGAWQYAPFDERIAYEATRTEGEKEYPDLTNLNWYGYNAPGNRNDQHPPHQYSHRYILRTQLEVPETYNGSSFVLRFEALSLINTLFINKQRVDSFDIHYGQWQVDVSDHLKPGQTNEILLVVKDPWYALGYHSNEEPGELAQISYVPWSLWNQNQGVTGKLDWPIKGSDQTGIIDSVFLVATGGPVYVDDVFVKPFPITEQSIEVDVTLANRSDQPREVSARIALVPAEGGDPVVDPAEVKGKVEANETTTLTVRFPSEGIGLWWPEDPTLHHAVTTVSEGGQVIDRQETRFGNRQWEVREDQFFLNGVRQHLRANLTNYGSQAKGDLNKVLEEWRAMGQNMFRRRFQFPWNGLSPREMLTWADEVGVNVRQNAGTFDGQHASYQLAWKKDQQSPKQPHRELFDNWRAQMLNGVKARRNHPSVMIWELDNEIVYINGRNFGNLDVVEPEFAETSDRVMEMDPTRVTVTGGGAAGLEQRLPTYGVHYFEVADRHYPDDAYTLERSVARYGTGEGGKVWPLDLGSRPIFMSETAFLPGRNGEQFAAAAGERAFLGKALNPDAFALLQEMYGAGYRWAEVGAVHFWIGSDVLPDDHGYHYWQPIAPLMREWDRSFASGQEITRTFKLFNDTSQQKEITVEARLVPEDEGEVVLSSKQTVAAGDDVTFQQTFKAPQVSEPTPMDFVITATADGDEVYRHAIPYRFLPDSGIDANTVNQRKVTVWDPSGAVQQRLQSQGVQFYTIETAEGLTGELDMLIVGPNVIDAELATSNRWMQLLAGGTRLLVLEQEHPLHYQATPADLSPNEHDGRMAFSQDLEHPVFAGLAQADMSFWGSDHVVYQNIYTKPSRGAVSLVHADDGLEYSAMVFAPLDQSGMMLSQLAIGQKLESNIVARTLFDNLVEYVATYAPTVRPTTVAAEEGSAIDELLGEIALQYDRVSNPLEAIKSESEKAGIVIVDGTAENLRALADHADAVQAYFEKGGWVMVMNVTPDSLEPFNQLVGYDHIIRPFGMERTMFTAVRDPLTAGLTLRDVVMGSGERIQNFNRDEWPADDAFEYILDLKDIAPFAEFPEGRDKGPGADGWPRNMVNGFTGGDHWRLTYTLAATGNFTLDFPRKETVTEVVIDPSSVFNAPTKVEIRFDGGEESVTLEMNGTDELQSFSIDPVEASQITFDFKEFERLDERDLMSIDNIQIMVERPEDFENKVRPLLNIGGLIKYPRGEGGVLVNQYRIAGTETNPVNRGKKQTVMATLLRNLGAQFSGARAVVAGANVRYEPISLEGVANLYLKADSGFPVKNANADLSAVPLGERTFADVRYSIRDFETSPLESGVTLQNKHYQSNADSDEVTIDVGRRADALFFLHTYIWRHNRDWQPNNRNPDPPVVFEYLVKYSDGTEEVVPIQYKRGVEHYLREDPKALPNAAVAWQNDENDRHTALYQFQWNNPNPDKDIASVTLRYGDDKENVERGLPILLAITAAENVTSEG